jgi:hypothetical protein
MVTTMFYPQKLFIGQWLLFLPFALLVIGTRDSVVGSGTMLQAGRSRVRFAMRSLDFSIFLILPATLWPWGQLSL